jgi:hypothetical protein
MDLEEGGEPGGAGCADNSHAHQVSDHVRTPQQLHPVHAPDQTRSWLWDEYRVETKMHFSIFAKNCLRRFRKNKYFPENVRENQYFFAKSAKISCYQNISPTNGPFVSHLTYKFSLSYNKFWEKLSFLPTFSRTFSLAKLWNWFCENFQKMQQKNFLSDPADEFTFMTQATCTKLSSIHIHIAIYPATVYIYDTSYQ